jgi:hypothetical protein
MDLCAAFSPRVPSTVGAKRALPQASTTAVDPATASPDEAYGIGIPVEFILDDPTCSHEAIYDDTTCDVCIPFDDDDSLPPRSAAPLPTALLLPPAPAGPPPVPSLQQHTAEDSVEAWVSDSSAASFELLDCDVNGLPNLCQAYGDDDDGCMPVWACADVFARPSPDGGVDCADVFARPSPDGNVDELLPPGPYHELPDTKAAPPAMLGVDVTSSSGESSYELAVDFADAQPSMQILRNDLHRSTTTVRPTGASKCKQSTRRVGAAGPLSAAPVNKISSGVRIDRVRIKKNSPRGSSKLPVSLDELADVYHLPRETAASTLGIGCTFLKKICRTYGVRRWPSRKLAALKNHIDELQLLVSRRSSYCYSADLLDSLDLAITDAENTRQRIYKDPNFGITRDLYRELHTFRKQCQA